MSNICCQENYDISDDTDNKTPTNYWGRQNTALLKFDSKPSEQHGIFGRFRTSINADRKKLVTSYLVWLD